MSRHTFFTKSINSPRQVQFNLFYDEKNISADVSNYLLSFSYTERAEDGKSDDLKVTFENVDGLWSSCWYPKKGASLRASINVLNWFKPGDYYRLDCGSFEIDDFSDSAPPAVFSIGALSVGISSSIRGETKYKAWENIKISEITKQLAVSNGFDYYFNSDYDPVIDRFDQKDKSDLDFLVEISQYAGLQVKIARGKLIVYRESLIDNQDVLLTLNKNVDGYISHNFRDCSANIFAACQVQYLDAKQQKLITYQYTPDGKSGILGAGTGGGQRIDEHTRMVITDPQNSDNAIKEPKIGKVLKINKRCSSLSEAEELAKSSLRNKNKKEITGTITLLGNPSLRAGIVIEIKGFNIFDNARYMIYEVNHAWNKQTGLVTTVYLRGILNY